MKKIFAIAAITTGVLMASAFQSKETTPSTPDQAGIEASSDTVPGKKKGDTARHRYPTDTTRRTPPRA